MNEADEAAEIIEKAERLGVDIINRIVYICALKPRWFHENTASQRGEVLV